jgi:hypothetical protein
VTEIPLKQFKVQWIWFKGVYVPIAPVDAAKEVKKAVAIKTACINENFFFRNA